MSLSPAWDDGRAPAGKRALTISTHTALKPWWQLRRWDSRRYEQRKQYYVDRMLRAAEVAVPHLREAVASKVEFQGVEEARKALQDG